MKAATYLLIFLVASILFGCADVPVPKEVDVPVPTPVYCTPNLGPEPAYPDTDEALKAAPNIFEAAKLLVEGRLMRIQRDTEKSAALKACSGPA